MEQAPAGAGGNSFPHINSDKLFNMLPFENDTTFLDLACGYGDYSLEASKYIGESGRIYAVDQWESGIKALEEKSSEQNIEIIETENVDIAEGISLKDQSVDICLISTALHDLVIQDNGENIIAEAERVLKERGVLAIIEFKKQKMEQGPPLEHKISADKLGNYLEGYAFKKEIITEIGSNHYVAIYRKGN